MAQQIVLQPPHDSIAELEYEKGGRFKMSVPGTVVLISATALLVTLYWFLTHGL